MSLLPSSWSRLPTSNDDLPVEVERRKLRKVLIAAVVAVVLLGIGAWLVLPRVTRRLEQRSVRQAREFLQQQDYRRAELMLEQAAQDNPADFDTRRELARFYQEADSSRAFAAWRELVRDEPANDENRLGLAEAGLRLDDLPTAREALSGVGPAVRSGARYHRLAAGVALRSGDQASLERELAEIARLEPDDARAQFNHQALELASGDPARAAVARDALARLAQAGPMRIRATLELIRDATRRTGPTVFTDLAERLLPPRPGPRLPSWLTPPRSLFDLVQYMEGQPSPRPEDAAMLAEWMRRQGMGADAALWIGSLEPATQANPAVLAVRVACLVQIPDWRGVAVGLRAGAWGRVPDDALSLAFAARMQRDRLHRDHATDTWNDAVEASARSPEGLRVLLRLAQSFGWRDEAEATLRALTKVTPRDASAWQSLAISLASRGQTGRLADMYEDWARSSPDDAAVQGVHLWLEVLLHRARPADFSQGGNTSPAYAAARALALRSIGRPDEAQAVLSDLSPAGRADPRVALVQGVLWAEAGRRDDSARALALAAAGPLLPEERELLELGQQKARAHP